MDRTKSRGAMWGLLALVLAIGLIGSALAGGSALAARGGPNATGCKGGPKHCGTTPSTATCAAAPNPLGFGTYGTVNGSGFAPNAVVSYSVSWPGGTGMGFVETGDTGSFSMTTYGSVLGTVTATFSGGGVTATCAWQVV